MTDQEIYTKATKRLARCGANDPTAQIIALEKEIMGYRARIDGLLMEKAGPQTDTTILRAKCQAKRRQNTTAAYIDTCPTCSECGGPIENPTIEYKNMSHPQLARYTPIVKPEKCPHCGAIFHSVVFQAELPDNKEDTDE